MGLIFAVVEYSPENVISYTCIKYSLFYFFFVEWIFWQSIFWQMECRYQIIAILHGPYSPDWTLSIVSLSRRSLEVRDWVDNTTTHLSILARASADSMIWPVYAANLRDPKSQFHLCVVNVATMSCDRICPQTAIMQEGISVEYGSLSNFESVVVH
jgi:hypothetical protein